MVWIVGEESRADIRFIVEVTNISDNDVKDGVLVGGLGYNLSEAGTDVQKMFEIQVILITTADKSTTRVGCFETIVVGTDMLN